MFSSKNEANFILTVQIHCLYRLSFHVCLEESDNYLRNLQWEEECIWWKVYYVYIKIKINKFWLRVPFVQLGTTDIYVDVGSETVI